MIQGAPFKIYGIFDFWGISGNLGVGITLYGLSGCGGGLCEFDGFGVGWGYLRIGQYNLLIWVIVY